MVGEIGGDHLQAILARRPRRGRVAELAERGLALRLQPFVHPVEEVVTAVQPLVLEDFRHLAGRAEQVQARAVGEQREVHVFQHQVPEFLSGVSGRYQRCGDRPRRGPGDAFRAIPMFVELQERPCQADALDPAALEYQIAWFSHMPTFPCRPGRRLTQATSAGRSTTVSSTPPINRRASRASIRPAPRRPVDSAPQATPKRRHWSGARPS